MFLGIEQCSNHNITEARNKEKKTMFIQTNCEEAIQLTMDHNEVP